MQLKVGLRSGETVTFGLPADLGSWQARQEDPSFQSQIRGMGILHEGVYYALPPPTSFRRVAYMVEVRMNGTGFPASARVGYVADDVQAWLTIYCKGNPPMARFDVRRVGRPRYLAPGVPWPQDRKE